MDATRAADQWVCSTAARCTAPRQIATVGELAQSEPLTAGPAQRGELATGRRSVLAWVQTERSHAARDWWSCRCPTQLRRMTSASAIRSGGPRSDERRALLTAGLLSGCRGCTRRFRGWARDQHPGVPSVVLGETDDRAALGLGAGPPSVAVAAPGWTRPRTDNELATRPGRARREEEGMVQQDKASPHTRRKSSSLRAKS